MNVCKNSDGLFSQVRAVCDEADQSLAQQQHQAGYGVRRLPPSIQECDRAQAQRVSYVSVLPWCEI